jgi:opacity protein-like surface antigen
MKRLAVVLGAVLAIVFTGTAAAQAYRHELSFFGAYDKVDEPEDFTLSIFNLRYGHFLTEQVVATLGVNRTNFDTNAAESTTTALTGGIKYYFTRLANRGLVPFAEAAIGFAMVDTGVDDSTDLTWEVGGGAAYFISEATSIDASLRWYQTDTDGGDTEGIRLFIGMTTRF